MTAVLFRHCGGCGQAVSLHQWQEGPLGCDDCRSACRSVALEPGGRVVIEYDSPIVANRVFDFHTAALAQPAQAA